MTYTDRMLETSPAATDFDPALLADCIRACLDCAQACTACADACLAEDTVAELRRCIRLDLDCADVCVATARVLSRLLAYEPEPVMDLLRACAAACRMCGDECDGHADMHEHCRVCAEACRRCEAACETLLEP